jgi:hypothetical protein
MSLRETAFSWDVLDALLQRGANKVDSASIMDCSEDTIERRIKERFSITFSEYRERRMAGTRLKLVETALDKALNGNIVMLIFCLKNICHWQDNAGATNQPTIINNIAVLSSDEREKEIRRLDALAEVVGNE